MTAPVRRVAGLVEGSPGALRSHGVPCVDRSLSALEGVGATSPPSAAEQLRTLARRVRRLGLNGRFDPEAAFIERDDLAHALGRLATDLERLAADRPSRATAARAGSPTVSPRRLAAALAARTREVARLRALLARAVRPGRRRRPTVSATQLALPLPEITDDR